MDKRRFRGNESLALVRVFLLAFSFSMNLTVPLGSGWKIYLATRGLFRRHLLDGSPAR